VCLILAKARRLNNLTEISLIDCLLFRSPAGRIMPASLALTASNLDRPKGLTPHTQTVSAANEYSNSHHTMPTFICIW
jgi:hypothetical protein